MDKNTILNALKKYLISELSENHHSFTEVDLCDDTVLSHIGITSVEFVLFLVYIEDELDVTFEDEDLLMSNDITLGELVDRTMKLCD